MSFADKLSLVRIIFVPIFVSLLLYSKSFPFLKKIAIGVFVLAVLSDFLDGLVARIKKEKSSIGVVLDPLADKLLLITAFITLYLLKVFPYPPLWLVIIVVSRDFIILLG
ncbi:MAG: CDP-diacylglycerol--glycerol-3-phosphate 3-phosphatidyltransferase, partial [Candidatus Omnitrophota bacterium]